MHRRLFTPLALLAMSNAALAQTVVSNYDDLAEGFYGSTFTYNGVTYTDVNNVSGIWPDGNTFEPGDGVDGLGDEIIVENAALFYGSFPGWGSPTNVLTFGAAYIVGDNLSLGAISTVTMQLNGVADAVALDMAYYENGPWGGIEYHLDAYMGAAFVGSDVIAIADGGGRDNVTTDVLSVDGVQFDSLKLYATYGGDYSGPRIIIDDLTVNYVPAPPAGAAALATLALAARRRR